MESPVKRGDQLIPYEEVIDELRADTVQAVTQISIHKPTGFSYKSSSVYLMLQVCIITYVMYNKLLINFFFYKGIIAALKRFVTYLFLFI